MANFGKLLTDVPTELTAVHNFVNGIENAVTTAKANGLTAVEITDIEVLVPEGEAVVTGGEAVAEDLGATI
jgi:hypothetical protein